MSSIDSVLNSTATLFTRDIYGKYFKKSAEDRHYLKVGRIVTVALLILGITTSKISTFFPGIYVAIQTFLSFLQGPTFSVLLQREGKSFSSVKPLKLGPRHCDQLPA